MNKLMKAEGYRVLYSSNFFKWLMGLNAILVVLVFITDFDVLNGTMTDFAIMFGYNTSTCAPIILAILCAAIAGMPFQNKTFQYEVMAGNKISHIMLSRVVVITGIVTMVFCLFMGGGFAYCGLKNGIGTMQQLGIRMMLYVVIVIRVCIISILITLAVRQMSGLIFVCLRVLVFEMASAWVDYLVAMLGWPKSVLALKDWFMMEQAIKIFEETVTIDSKFVIAVIASCILEGIFWYVISYRSMTRKNF